MKPIIEIENLSKRYRIGGQKEQYLSLRDEIAKKLSPAWRKAHAQQEEFWALKDVSFSVQEGEAVGIIGRNGAGKSTLLKILSQITPPTTGRVVMRGRVASLLEVGTGFHPELTGRENIYLNGAILGMTRREIARKFDEIVAFAEIEQFLDTPVKRYSSGMYVRLAFAVAAHLEPEILVVDEVLAVGDAEFQKKCLGKMGEVTKAGRTVLFVSHNMAAVATLTQKCVLLDSGIVRLRGLPNEAISAYLMATNGSGEVYYAPQGRNGPIISRVLLETSEPANVQYHGEPMEIHIELSTPAAIDGARVAVRVCNAMQNATMYLWTYDSVRPMCRRAGKHALAARLPRVRLCAGRYTLTVRLAERYGGATLDVVEGACPFEVTMKDIVREGGWPADDGAYMEDCDWSVCSQGPETASIGIGHAASRLAGTLLP